jgi:hypothetical protein
MLIERNDSGNGISKSQRGLAQDEALCRRQRQATSDSSKSTQSPLNHKMASGYGFKGGKFSIIKLLVYQLNHDITNRALHRSKWLT